jgi:hypothetical protein
MRYYANYSCVLVLPEKRYRHVTLLNTHTHTLSKPSAHANVICMLTNCAILYAILCDNVYNTGGDLIGTASATLSFPFPNAFLANSGVRCQLYANAGERISYFVCCYIFCCYNSSSHTLYTASD